LGKSGEFTTLGYVQFGAGRFIFSTYGPYDCRDEPTKAQVLRIYRNLVSQAQPLTEPAQAQALLNAAAPGRKLILWRRDWDGSVESRLIWRPCGPRPEDLLAALDFACAREEIDTAFFCVQAAADLGELRIQSDALRAADGREASATALRVLVMGQEPEVPIDPPKNYAKVDRSRRGPFYLIPMQQLEPRGRQALRLTRFEPRTVCELMAAVRQPVGNGLPASPCVARPTCWPCGVPSHCLQASSATRVEHPGRSFPAGCLTRAAA